jgi:class 3 adenylate cyclase/tetratricopeptide (TPR) repeat protein
VGSRHCGDCGHGAAEHARFCERCGAALTPSARPLRAPSRLEEQILQQRTSIEGEHKQVTVLYADIVGSMQLTHVLEGERWGFILDRFLAIAAGAVHAFEGTVNQFTGDGLMAVFGAPLAHEDHARRACLAALELRQEVATLTAELARTDGVEFAVRCGLNSGAVVVGAIGDDVHMDFVPLGNTTALGKRIEALAPPGSAAIGPSTAALVEGEFELRDLGEFVLKGAADRLHVRELVGPGVAQTRLQAVAATRGLSPFVGRDAERAALDAALRAALAGNGQAVAIVADPGVGKSRLVHEFVADCVAGGLPVASTAGVAHGRYVPLLPILALYREYFGIGPLLSPEAARERIETKMVALDPSFAGELPLLFEILGVPDPRRPLRPVGAHERQSRLLSLLSQAIRAHGPHAATVLVIEDLHWLDDASRAVLEALVTAIPGTRTVLVGTTRPEYAATWADTGPHARISLEPLEAAPADDLLTQLLGRDPSLDGLADMIGARARGNPFFIEEIVQALAESGQLAGPRGAYRLAAELDGVTLPATIQAGLAARIDRLPARAKALVQTMAVIGDEIPRHLLGTVSDLDGHELDDAVAVLLRAHHVVADDTGGARDYIFRHPLTREVAYGSQLSEHRARTHRRVAAAIEDAYPDDLDERAALLAHHSEAAGRELDAAGWHARAAAWAERTSPADGLRHWRRVRHLVSALDASPERDALAASARQGILGLVWRLGGSAEETAAIRAESRADGGRTVLDLYSAGTLMHGARERDGLAGFRDVCRKAFTAGDAGGALTASTGVAYASWIAGSLREGIETLDRGLAVARDDPTVGAGEPYACPLAHAYGQRGLCRGYTGDLEQARRDFDRAIALAREYEDPVTLSAAHANLALIEAEAGDTGAAHRHATLGLEISEPLGDLAHSVACAVPIALALARDGRFDGSLTRAESNLTTIRGHGVGLYYEPLLLATIAICRLGLDEPDLALATAEEAVDIADARGLGACALRARVTLAQVLGAVRGAGAGDRIDGVLTDAEVVMRKSAARLFAAPILDARESLRRLHEEIGTAFAPDDPPS